MLTFEPVSHIYRYRGQKVPNVTNILEPLHEMYPIASEILEKARQEGNAIHKMVELACNDDLGEMPTWLQLRFEAWRKFVDETGFKFIASEQRVYHPMYGYAGTLDLAGGFESGPCIIDIKRSFAAGQVIGIQLAAYREAKAAIDKHWKNAQRWALRLNADGTYNMKQFRDEEDFGVFVALLKIQRYREKYP